MHQPPKHLTRQTNLVLIQRALDVSLVAEGDVLRDEGRDIIKDSANTLLGIIVSLPEVGHTTVVLMLLPQLALHPFPHLIHLQHSNMKNIG